MKESEKSQKGHLMNDGQDRNDYRYPDHKPGSKFTNERCDVCNRRFFVENYFSNPRIKYCSNDCEQEALRQQEEKRKAEIEQHIQQILPPKYWEVETDRERDLIEIYGKSAFLWGDVGTGKSVLAASIAKKFLREGGSVRWENYPDLTSSMQSAFRSDYDDPYYIADQVARFKGLLVLDDLGAQKLTEFVRQQTYYIINQREENMIATVITSNFSLLEIANMIDKRVSSRIIKMCEILKLEGPDRRLNGESYRYETDKKDESGA